MSTILAFIDFSDVTEPVARTAGRLSRQDGGKLYLIHVASPEADFDGTQIRDDTSRPTLAAEMRQAHRRLQAMETGLRSQGTDATSLLVRGTSVRGDPSEKVLEEVARLRPDLIVVGSHGHTALYNLVVGTVTQALIRHAPCPVVVVPSRRTARDESDAVQDTTLDQLEQ